MLLVAPVITGHPFGFVQLAGIKFFFKGEVPFFNLLKGIFLLGFEIPNDFL